MPLISKLACRCGYATELTEGSYTCVIDERGQKSWDFDAMGFMITETNCICFHCTEQFYLDLDRNQKKCISCQSDNVKTFREASAEKCPKCKTGTMHLIHSGVS